MSIRQIYKWIILRIKKRHKEYSECFLILDGDWLNNLTALLSRKSGQVGL